MGESSFSKGFGQVKPNEASSDPQMDETWKSIPGAIFDGLADRYKVLFPLSLIHSLLMIPSTSMSRDFYDELDAMFSLTGPSK